MQALKKAVLGNALLITSLLFLTTTLSSCEVVKGIFKAGMIVGVILIIIIVVIVLAVIRMFKK